MGLTLAKRLKGRARAWLCDISVLRLGKVPDTPMEPRPSQSIHLIVGEVSNFEYWV